MALPASRRLDFSEVPIVDIAPLAARREASATVAEIDRACSEVGFFYVHGHGVPAALTERLRAEAARFFARPREEKMRTRIDARMRGYLPLYYRSHEGTEHAGISHQEGFWMGPERAPDPARPFDGPNRWPEGSPGLRQAMKAYYVALEALARRLQHAFAAALAVDPVRFRAFFERAESRLKLNHYPPQDAPERVEEIGVRPHSDTGAFTILWQDASGGLEIENRSGEWVGVPPIAETFVINLGNVMQIWSFGRYSSTPHRVVNRSGGDRYSIPFFVNPSHDAAIEPLVPTGGPRFEPFPFGEYQRAAFKEIFPVGDLPGGVRRVIPSPRNQTRKHREDCS